MKVSAPRPAGPALAGALLGLIATAAAAPLQPKPPGDAAPAGGARAFLAIASVLQSPRCRNCHPAADAPLQTDAGLPHAMLVRRGPDGRGAAAMRCANCHMVTNHPDPHGPPGAPNWHLPPPDTPMVFEGRSPEEICRILKDPQRNGGKDLSQLVDHLTTDGLVLWGWNPGPGRTPPPLSQPEFARIVRAWAASGAPCPGDARDARSE